MGCLIRATRRPARADGAGAVHVAEMCPSPERDDPDKGGRG